ncbi:MAG: DUF4912 domain-containing protein [Candidatus Omnitrophota bacterium]
MALSPRKKTRIVSEEPPKKVHGNASIKKTAAKPVASTLKRVPVIKRSASVPSPKQPLASDSEAWVMPPEVEARTYREMPGELPDNYGDNQIYLLVRDPYWIYAYWEIQEGHQRHHLANLGGSLENVVSVLRVYDVTEKGKTPSFSDIVLQDMARCWYINTQPNRSYFVEIGLLHRDGRFICLARSNHVTTPRSGMSEIIDDQWMSIDFDKMYALSGGFQVGKSSAELRRLMEERLRSAITSGSGAGAVSSLSSPVRIKQRGFHFWLECELIIYGGTEPNAKVTMQGRPVQLRPDGTFTLRYGLPDGKFIFDCHAKSADGVEERVITPIVSRNTERPAPVIKAGKHP